MKITVFGGTGMIGSRIVAELEQRGHGVTVATRSGGTDITDAASVADAAAGSDAVVCAISARGVEYSLVDAATALTEGLRKAGVSRIAIVGGAGSLLVPTGGRLVDTPDFHEEWKPEALQGADALEFYRGVDDLDWTFVSPAAYIHPGERTGSYQIGGDQMVVDANGNSEISAEDYAIAIADLLEQDSHKRERVGVAW